MIRYQYRLPFTTIFVLLVLLMEPLPETSDFYCVNFLNYFIFNLCALIFNYSKILNTILFVKQLLITINLLL